MLRNLVKSLSLKNCLIAFFSSAFLAFGLYNVHSLSRVTEGGVLGLTLLLDHWFHISPSVSGAVLNAACYLMGWRLLGKTFIAYSAISTLGFSLSYAVYECFPPIWPGIAEYPLLAAVVGSVFVGLGAGFCVRIGGAPGGDDALAMTISHLAHIGISRAYLASDLTVLLLSLSYIAPARILYSLVTVTLSSFVIGRIQKLPRRHSNVRLEG